MKPTCLTHDEIEARLRERGVQPTAQRIAICRFVLCEADHPTADQVKAWADANFPMMSLATVYNTLGTLVTAGLLKELRFPHTDKVVYDDNTLPHHHFYDEDTGKLMDLSPDEVLVEASLGREFSVSSISVLITGKMNKKPVSNKRKV